MIVPNMPMPSTNAAAEQTPMTGSLNSTSGMIGSAAFDSLYGSAKSITTDRAISESTRGEVQPYLVAQVSASSSATTETINGAKPAQSSCRLVPRGFMCGN